jgi:hypothetical protein
VATEFPHRKDAGPDISILKTSQGAGREAVYQHPELEIVRAALNRTNGSFLKSTAQENA